MNDVWSYIEAARKAIGNRADEVGNCPVCGGGIGDNHYGSCPVNLLDLALELKPKKVEGHLVDGEFQSDKYPWCKPGFVPLKLTDVDAQVALKLYAKCHRDRDAEFSADLEEAIRLKEEEAKKSQNG